MTIQIIFKRNGTIYKDTIPLATSFDWLLYEPLNELMLCARDTEGRIVGGGHLKSDVIEAFIL